jgi:hypothetical protein
MEIMGLAIIIILVTLGLFFIIFFMSNNSDVDNLEDEYADSQLSANLLNSMLQMTAIDCNNKQIKSLFRDCALNEKIICNNGMRSCEYLNHTLGKIINKTLVEWRRDFYFVADGTSSNFDGGSNIYFGRPCADNVGSDVKQYPIQAQSSTVMISLHICDISMNR